VAQEVLVRSSPDGLRISAPSLRFLTGKPLERLRDGAAVPFDIQVTILADNKQTVLRRSFERFLISFDVWEEKFSVTRMRSTRASVAHLSAEAAEAWCLANLELTSAGLPSDKELWVRIDVRAQQPRDRSAPVEEIEGLSLAALIELFSRPVKASAAMHWRADSGALRLNELRRNGVK
jgi:hypothetical protein